VVFKEAELLPLAYQLVEIRALCEVLFEARVHALVRIRRVPVSKQDTGTSEYLTGSKITTNAVTAAVVTPYEVTFHAFSPELAAVLTGLQQSRHAFVVKMLDVEHIEDSGTLPIQETPYPVYPVPGVPLPGGVTPTPQSESERMRQRYGQTPGGARGGGRDFQQRYGRGPGAQPGIAPAPSTLYAPAGSSRRGPEVVLEEKPLKVTLTVEAVRLPLTAQ
jgi:hypothetical protein